jgi:23S rRNA (adenine2503-C2)-methyltransferase
MKALLHDLSRAELEAACREAGAPAYRAGQAWQWLYKQRVRDWDSMANLPKALRERLSDAYDVCGTRTVAVEGEAGATRKLVLEMRDGQRVECVLIPAEDRYTLCVSTQVGCKFGCAFCASGQDGFMRDLTAGEIVIQFLEAARHVDAPITHIVFMGMGEPFDNYDNVIKAIRIFNDDDGLNIGARRMTISTCGVIDGIKRLQGEGIQVELSVSLHSVDPDLRTELIPVNQRYPVDELLDACRAYARKTRRIITFEYTLIDGVNDGLDDATRLAASLADLPCRVNVIPLSPVAEYEGKTPSGNRVHRFAQMLNQAGVHCTIRKSKGSKVQAACGQLRRSL